ncbi:MAG: YceI family protein [Anaerolineales bacterium]
MNRNILIVGVVGLLVVGGLGTVAVYNWVLGPTLAASAPINAIPLALESTPTVALVIPNTAASAVATGEATPTVAPTIEATAPAATGGLTVFQISQADSEVRFIIFEELRGQPVDVVGRSNQVAGELAVNPADLSTAQVGVIQINARTLVTDQDQRNRAIRNRILNTDTYEFITFTPTEVRGLSGGAAPGDTQTFQLVGDLTIRDVTQPVVFEVTVTAESATRLKGSAFATITRADFGLIIPSVPSVANVGETVKLELDFVALAK